MKAFLDTNVLVYRVDFAEPLKQQRAVQLVTRLFQAGEAVLSTQVLQEFYNTATSKLGLGSDDAAGAVRRLTGVPVIQVNVPILHAAMQRHAGGQFSFWDALIVEAALAGGCQTLYSEDMQDGFVVDGMTIENPFAGL